MVRSASFNILQRARARMLRAARILDEAVREVRAARRLLSRSPGYQRGRRAARNRRGDRAGYTLELWAAMSIDGVLADTSLAEAASWIRADARPNGLERSLAAAVEADRG
jgi:hypothetical protein